MEKYIATGNDYISLPTITQTGEVESVGFLSMSARGLLSLSGAPFLRAFVKENGVPLSPSSIHEEKLGFWIPQFEKRFVGGVAYQTIFAPVGGKGFLARIEYENTSQKPQTITLGFDGEWETTTREINSTDALFGQKTLTKGWHDAPVYALNGVLPLFCFSFLCDDKTQNDFLCDGETATYRMQKQTLLKTGEKTSLTLAVGFGMDGVSTVTSALDFLRQGFDGALQTALCFLAERTVQTDDTLADFRLHYNLFFCYFFAGGKTLDSEEFVMVTSRSPRYYVSAAYWDRDSLLWAFPAVLAVDKDRAKQMLSYAFSTQLSNIGEHSRFIDGTLLEPGFELDELCAPIVALCRYVESTKDFSFLEQPTIQDGVRFILDKLSTKKHAERCLYETFLYPSDDMRKYPYLTYDNALLAFALEKYGNLSGDNALSQHAERIRRDIQQCCIVKKDGKETFAWCVDLKGNYELYDEPPGSLVLLAHLGLCDKTDEVFQNTLSLLQNSPYSFQGKRFSALGCAHANHPWVISYCNECLAGFATKDTKKQLLTMGMDNALACESINEDTGEVETGEAFATCAGFYAYALMLIFNLQRIPG